MALHKFKKAVLKTILKNVVNKTLGEVDVNNVFARTITHPKITGIAGDVVEQSILGYPADSEKKPDLIVDDIPTEVKTTGIRKPKKKSDFIYEAKEPMSITAVSPNSIVNEEFDDSSFWHKLEHMLIIYYHYDSPVTVKAADYANFFIKGYHFHEFTAEEREILKNDWLIVRDFIRRLQKDHPKDPSAEYPRISSELRKNLMLIDTAPKWPHAPRFRLKRAAVSTLVQKHFGTTFEQLDDTYSSFKELDAELHKITDRYRGKTVRELIKTFHIPFDFESGKDASKGISEQIIVKMFGGHTKKISKIELFTKVGLVPKTIVQTMKGAQTEDMKLFTINFPEWLSDTFETEEGEIVPMSFETSFVYNYFSEHQFLCILFEEPSTKAKLLDNKFIGFKRLIIDEDTLNTEVRKTWDRIRYLVKNNLLVDVPELKIDGTQKVGHVTGLPSSAPNFPKAIEYNFFLKGTGQNSSKKPFSLNDVKMYHQQLWIKGDIVVKMLEDIDFI